MVGEGGTGGEGVKYIDAVHRRRFPRLIDADLFMLPTPVGRALIFRFGVEVLRQRKAMGEVVNAQFMLANAIGREVIEA